MSRATAIFLPMSRECSASAGRLPAVVKYPAHPPMAVFKTRPRLRLLLVRPLVAGETGEFIAELECPKAVPVSAVNLTFFGDVVWSHKGRHAWGQRGTLARSRFIEHEQTLIPPDRARVLEAGLHRLRAQLRLDAASPGSWSGEHLGIEYGVLLHAEIPWWPDARADFSVQVLAAPRSEAEGAPKVYVSHSGGPPAKGAYVEVSLGQQLVRPGGVLRASVALGNVASCEYRKLLVSVLAHETLPAPLGGSVHFEHSIARWTVPIAPGVGELQPIPFRLLLPEGIAPGFQIYGHQMQWLLKVHAEASWMADASLRVPIEVGTLSPDASESADPEALPLAVGADRLVLIWTAVARENDLSVVNARLRGQRGDAKIEIVRGQSASGAQVIAHITLPSLGVGLTHVEIGHGLLGLDRHVTLVARDRRQSQAIIAKLGPLLDEVQARDYALLFARDDQLRLAMPGAGLELAPLSAFARFVLRFAAAIDGAREDLPPPAVAAPLVEPWQQAARSLRGRLRLSDLDLEIEREGDRVVIACVFGPIPFEADAPLQATRLELRVEAAIPSRLHLQWSSDVALPEHEWPLAELVAPPTWARPGAKVGLLIDAQSVRVFLPAPLVDPRAEFERVEQLFAIGRRLRGEQGPYR
ncbi:hypothetical protein G6O69_28175 [Pseudenhygromyxa sp. WMMC2535]|uniref:hypothetical protein n=1 Tax=Pseudenhygromyxa sp. WMMC2535 TaxID=2712867 RepID=UPI001595AE47|nr:hypothetical protein [Pseudenhygromyxa sp. WMMC2535]NVB41744.1 hypothetical protein [Pseudenhygromyxa sp. WMMC2535]